MLGLLRLGLGVLGQDRGSPTMVRKGWGSPVDVVGPMDRLCGPWAVA